MNRNTSLGTINPLAAKQACILVVEDDESISQFLKERLESDGYRVETAGDGLSAEAQIGSFHCDLIILDLTLPNLDGAELLGRVRARHRFLPVLVLTGRAAVEDKIRTLDLGADDYLQKPFQYGELVARVRALLRRTQPEDTVRRFDDLELNRMERTVKRAGREIELTAKEFALLEYLMLNLGQRLSRAMIMEHVWKLDFNAATNVVDVYINYLRNKIDRGFGSKLIRTVRGVGYQFGQELPDQDRSHLAAN
ncbi:MAG: response regulator transcription factor [Terriglobia bacterium]